MSLFTSQDQGIDAKMITRGKERSPPSLPLDLRQLDTRTRRR